MGTLGAGTRPRDCLPSIGSLELEQIKKDGSRPLQKYPTMATTVGVSTAPLVSPTSIYSGPPPPYSYPSSTSSAPLQSGYISPPDSRRAVEDEKDQSHSQPQRQSLPSIHEALGNDNPLPYTGPPSSGPPSQPAHHAPPPLPANLISRSSVEGPPGPPNPFSNGSTSAPYLREPAYPYQNGQAGLSQAEASRSSLASLNSQDSRNPSLPSLSSGKSPTQSSRTGAPSLQVSQTSSAYEYSAQGSVGSMASPTTYSPYNQSFSYQSQPSSGTGSYPSAPYDSRPYTGVPWKAGAAEQHRMEEMKRSLVTRPAMPGQPHSDSVKRHLDSYDVETSLNEITDVSSRTLEFSRHYAARAHQTQRSGPILGSLPSLNEIDELLQLQRRNQDALIRIRTAVLNQEHALAEQRQRQAFKTDSPYDDDHGGMYHDEFKGAGGFAGADPKKRRGKAAPPGRCHSCNRAETPEWRRGPDGARTLCNACGLHYAKLTRKMGANKASSLGSNLKPKSGLDSASPTPH
ncbi:transcriptional regulator family: GATA type zinc finger [Paecilomyces variotii]|nr:transcriptional regulator family: GATA type zinc finger [Paecilomyces variotii]